MAKYNEKIYDTSIWLTITPSPAARSLPFYVTEAGHFEAYEGYGIRREYHDSCLLLYSLAGEGEVESEGSRLVLSKGQALVMDCRHPHAYRAIGRYWEFLWIHFHGESMKEVLPLLYPEGYSAISLKDSASFEKEVFALMERIRRSDIQAALEHSAAMHQLINVLYSSKQGEDDAKRGKEHEEDIERVLAYIGEHYAEPIVIDDMLRDIHVSKYHFIRIFKRRMGTTPYHYLMSYRMNHAKLLLCTTSHTVEEIAYLCGFSSGSNFIAQFRRQTGQSPLAYRRDFS